MIWINKCWWREPLIKALISRSTCKTARKCRQTLLKRLQTHIQGMGAQLILVVTIQAVWTSNVWLKFIWPSFYEKIFDSNFFKKLSVIRLDQLISSIVAGHHCWYLYKSFTSKLDQVITWRNQSCSKIRNKAISSKMYLNSPVNQLLLFKRNWRLPVVTSPYAKAKEIQWTFLELFEIKLC